MPRTWVEFQGPLFTLKVPSDWLIVATPDIQAMFIEVDKGQPVRANFIVSLRTVGPEVIVEGVLHAAQLQQKQYPEYELLNQDDIQAGEYKGVYQSFRWNNTDRNIKVIQAQTFYVVLNEMLFSVTATTDEARSEEMGQVFNEMFGSFKIVIPAQAAAAN